MKKVCRLCVILLCVTSSLYAQDMTPTLKEQFQSILMQGARINHFNRLCPQEKVYLHFDNTAYFQSETIGRSPHWFVCYGTVIVALALLALGAVGYCFYAMR